MDVLENVLNELIEKGFAEKAQKILKQVQSTFSKYDEYQEKVSKMFIDRVE